jgi:pilus assembly protein CpaE
MSQATSQTSIMAFVEPGETRQQVQAALVSDQEFRLVWAENGSGKAVSSVHAAAPDVILVDHQIGGQPSLSLVDELSAQFPEIPIVALLGEAESLQAQQYLLAGVRTFLIKPFTQVSLLNTLRRVQELESRRRAAQPSIGAGGHTQAAPLQILAVYSPRGGVGCSTIAVNLAIVLHEELDVRVLLMEGKMIFGHLGLMLNMRPQNSIADLIPHAGSLDEGLIEEVVSRHASGIHVLLGPPDLTVGQGVRPDDLYSVIKAVSRAYDVIVIDAGSFLNDNTVTLMDACDRVLLVTTPDLAALHDTSRFIQLTRTLGFPPEKVLTVLNRAGMQGGVKTREIAEALKHQLFAEISEGSASVVRSLNRGVPLMFGAAHNKMGRDIRALTVKLAEMLPGAEPRPTKDASAAAGTARAAKARLEHSPRRFTALRLLRR